MTWYDTNGNAQGTIGPVGVYSSVRISPDGTRVLANLYDPQQPSIADLWSYPASGGVPTRLTFGPGTKEFAVWSPDAKSIAYACDSGGRAAICRKPSDGSGVQEQLASFDEGLTDLVVVDWSPDGKYLSFNAKVAKSLRTELLVLPVAGDRKPIQVAPATANQYHGTFSPDSRWISYFSYEAGRPEVFVVPFPGPGGKFQISQTGGWNVVWSRAGRLYYSTLGNRLVEADLTLTGASVKVNGIRPLFETVFPSFPSPFYDVSADGKRFIVITSAASSPIKSIAVLLNWPAKLAPK
jgi:Tol biopolymer transport system component